MAKNENCCCNMTKGWIPLRSKIIAVENNEYEIIAPPGYIYVGYDENGKLMRVASGSNLKISCKCLQGEGNCGPFYTTGTFGTAWGCGGSCAKCEQVVSANKKNFISGGYLNLSERPEFLTTNKQIPAAFEEMYLIDEVKKAIEDFVKLTYQGLPFPELIEGEDFIAAPRGYSLAFVNIFGRAVIIPVPTISIPKSVEIGLNNLSVASGITASCKCSNSSGSCKLVKHNFGLQKIYYCESDECENCDLIISTSIANGAIITNYAAKSYKF